MVHEIKKMGRVKVFLLLIVLTCVGAINLTARAWQSLNKFPLGWEFPEANLLSRKDRDRKKPNTAIAFSGGGARAFSAAIGYLAGLSQVPRVKIALNCSILSSAQCICFAAWVA